MASSFSDRRITTKVLIVTGMVFGLVLALALITSFLLANKARQELANRQTLTYSAPKTDTGRQVKRIYLERDTPNGKEYIEILWDGTVNVYDKDHHLIKSGKQGFALINTLFNNIDTHWQDLINGGGGGCQLTIDTNVGTKTVDCSGSTGGGGGGGDIIKEIETINDDTFAPTPTFAPTSTPAVGRPEPTLTPWPTYYFPGVTVTPGGSLTPTPLPGYLTAPPFKCDDYHSNSPFIISNIICGVH